MVKNRESGPDDIQCGGALELSVAFTVGMNQGAR